MNTTPKLNSMKTTSDKIFITLIAIVLIALVLWRISIYNNKPFSQVQLSSSNYIINRSTMGFLDTVISVGLSQQNLTNLLIEIKRIPDERRGDLGEGIEVKAYVSTSGTQFIIYTDNLKHRESISIMAHELIHIKQYASNELKLIGGFPWWKGEMYSLMAVRYEDRPWEIEAVEQAKDLTRLITNSLYK